MTPEYGSENYAVLVEITMDGADPGDETFTVDGIHWHCIKCGNAIAGPDAFDRARSLVSQRFPSAAIQGAPRYATPEEVKIWEQNEHQVDALDLARKRCGTKVLRARFERAQVAYRVAYSRLIELEVQLHARYGPGLQDSWLSAADRKKLARLRRARDRAGDRVSDALVGTPRDWMHGVPAHWVYHDLTVEDAFRPLEEPLSVIPPIAYGYREPIR